VAAVVILALLSGGCACFRGDQHHAEQDSDSRLGQGTHNPSVARELEAQTGRGRIELSCLER
jgi:hypothetical protein